MIDRVEKINGQLACLILEDGDRILLKMNQKGWLHVSFKDSAIREVHSDLISEPLRCHGSAALWYERIAGDNPAETKAREGLGTSRHS